MRRIHHFESFRYYYDKDILAKIQGKRYAYQFNFKALSLACQAQQSPTPSDAKLEDLSTILAPLRNTPKSSSSKTSAQESTSQNLPKTSENFPKESQNFQYSSRSQSLQQLPVVDEPETQSSSLETSLDTLFGVDDDAYQVGYATELILKWFKCQKCSKKNACLF